MFKDDHQGDRLDIIVTFYATVIFGIRTEVKCEDTKEVIRSRKSKNGKQYKWSNEKGQMKKSNDIQNTTYNNRFELR